jgi:hypothetical protein
MGLIIALNGLFLTDESERDENDGEADTSVTSIISAPIS